MPTLIKNCGLTTPESIAYAIATGASYLGFVHHHPSPRHLSPEQIRAIYRYGSSDAARVIVLVNPMDATLAELPQPDFWQITGVTDPARIRDIHQRTGIPVITALRIRTHADLAAADRLESVSTHLLFDAYHPQEAGGTGHVFDWTLLTNMRRDKPWFIAGGLTARNVAEAIHRTCAPMVDVSSGIESAPGQKSLEKIAAFNAAVLQA